MNANISPVIQALEYTWIAIRKHHDEIPHAVVVVASGSEGRRKVWGHHATCRWHHDGEDLTEIMVSGEGLQRGPEPVLATMLHEGAHALADARSIQDTSRQGRYHNARFKALAIELGITVEKDSTIGWSVTTLGELGATRYAKQLAAIEKSLTLYRNGSMLPTVRGTGGARRSSNYVPAVCSCEPQRVIRLAPSSFELAPVLCGLCEEPFELKG
jgi:hypothetical protein